MLTSSATPSGVEWEQHAQNILAWPWNLAFELNAAVDRDEDLLAWNQTAAQALYNMLVQVAGLLVLAVAHSVQMKLVQYSKHAA